MKNNKTAKMGILAVVLLLAVAFAAVTTTLDIGGNFSIGKNNDEFDENVIFASAEGVAPYLVVNGVKQEESTVTLSENNKAITFTTDKFTNKGDNVELHYWVKNESANYSAKLSAVSCRIQTNDETNEKYLEVTEGKEHDDVVLATGETTDKANTVKVELAKTYIGDDEPEYTVTCTINATGVEK